MLGGGCIGKPYYTSATNRPLSPLPPTVAYRVSHSIFFQLLARCKSVAAVDLLCDGWTNYGTHWG